jgi:hypothetical protein
MSSPASFRATFRNQVLPLVLIFALLVLSAAFTPRWVTFREFQVADVLRLLTSLFTIALFVERSLEVFINTWRGPDAADLDSAVQAAEQALAAPAAGQNVADLQMRLTNVTRIKSRYKSETQRFALWSGLALGILISAIGIRTFESFAQPESLTALTTLQATAFRLVDVLITGAVVAGGSEGIHKLTQVYTNFMDASAKRAAQSGNVQPAAAPQPADQ